MVSGEQTGDCPDNAAWGTVSSRFLVKESPLPLKILRVIKGKSQGCCCSCHLIVRNAEIYFHRSQKGRGKLGKFHFLQSHFSDGACPFCQQCLKEQYCLKLVWLWPRSEYCTSYMWMTVNPPLRQKIHGWSANILAVRNSGFPPTELWVTCTLMDTSFRWVGSQSVNEQWRDQNRLAEGEWEFPRQILQVILLCNWELTDFLFCSEYVEGTSKGFIVEQSQLLLVCEDFTNTVVFLNVYHWQKKKRQNRDIYLKWELLWCEECFYFITFRRKLTRKTSAVVGKTPECFYKVVFDAINWQNHLSNHVDLLEIPSAGNRLLPSCICEYCLGTCS